MSIEDLLAADDHTRLDEIMDAAPPLVAPGVDQEHAAWRAIHHQETKSRGG